MVVAPPYCGGCGGETNESEVEIEGNMRMKVKTLMVICEPNIFAFVVVDIL